ncbi:hypothetical protein ACFO4N_09955 [Camelliibacillus cellulosilyticus]|uniref:Helix-turn-helix protein n=1 Tax=Camelliibacillus cellulosilyticus TaxID=2174486 RepID=A0ABV9GP70_9BACL
MLPGNIERFRSYSQFRSLDEFNQTMAKYMEIYSEAFTKGERKALYYLTHFCAKIPGVSNIRLCKLIAYVNQKEPLSRSTVERMLRKSVRLGILTLYHTVRRDGGYSHNVYVFNRLDGAVNKQLTDGENCKNAVHTMHDNPAATTETINLIKTNQKSICKNVSLEDLDASFCPEHIPQDFIQAAKPFFGADDIFQLWGIALNCYHRFNFVHPIEFYMGTVISAFKQTVFQCKKGKIKKTFSAYFYGTLCGMLHVNARREVMNKPNSPFPLPNWLEHEA